MPPTPSCFNTFNTSQLLSLWTNGQTLTSECKSTLSSWLHLNMPNVWSLSTRCIIVSLLGLFVDLLFQTLCVSINWVYTIRNTISVNFGQEIECFPQQCPEGKCGQVWKVSCKAHFHFWVSKPDFYQIYRWQLITLRMSVEPEVKM